MWGEDANISLLLEYFFMKLLHSTLWNYCPDLGFNKKEWLAYEPIFSVSLRLTFSVKRQKPYSVLTSTPCANQQFLSAFCGKWCKYRWNAIRTVSWSQDCYRSLFKNITLLQTTVAYLEFSKENKSWIIWQIFFHWLFWKFMLVFLVSGFMVFEVRVQTERFQATDSPVRGEIMTEIETI